MSRGIVTGARPQVGATSKVLWNYVNRGTLLLNFERLNWPALHQFEAGFQAQKWTLDKTIACRRHHDRHRQG